MNTLRSVPRRAGELWLTGVIYILACAGYLVYVLLWIVRVMQKKKKQAAAALTAAVLAGAAGWYLFLPLSPGGTPVRVVVEPGTPLAQTARMLRSNGVISSPAALIAWMYCSGSDKKVKAGIHTFIRHEGALSAGRKLLTADPVEVRITVPEGLTIEQTARHIAAALDIDTARFAALCRDTGIVRACGVARGTSLEGYLFPDTYRFAPSASPGDIIRRMTGTFFEQYRQLPRDDPVMNTLSLHEIVTMASIIEKEATLAAERRHISGVFHNRLRIGMPLGADPTVRYAIQKFTGPLRVSELRTPSPYNTRRYAGLPPGPICSPGLASLRAARKPLETRDLYFVAREDGSGEHDFSVTNREHVRKKLAIRKRRTRAKQDTNVP